MVIELMDNYFLWLLNTGVAFFYQNATNPETTNLSIDEIVS
jgi:hypothetical protein